MGLPETSHRGLKPFHRSFAHVSCSGTGTRAESVILQHCRGWSDVSVAVGIVRQKLIGSLYALWCLKELTEPGQPQQGESIGVLRCRDKASGPFNSLKERVKGASIFWWSGLSSLYPGQPSETGDSVITLPKYPVR